MSNDRSKCEAMSIEEATIFNMLKIDAIVEVLERKGLCTKQDLCDFITEFCRKNPLFELGREMCGLWYSHLGWHDRIRRRGHDKARETV
jgi:hypothetical protein